MECIFLVCEQLFESVPTIENYERIFQFVSSLPRFFFVLRHLHLDLSHYVGISCIYRLDKYD